MSISIVSNVTANLGALASSATSIAIDEPPVDFAALLSAQTLATQNSLLAAPSLAAVSKSDNTDALVETSEKSSGEPMDPSILALMFGIPQLPPTSTQIEDRAKLASGTEEDGASLKPLSEQTTQTALMSKNPDSPSTSKEIASLTNPRREMDHQLSPTANEAANIAADSTNKAGSTADFGIAMANTTLPQEKITPKQATVSTPLTSSAWPGQFSEKIVWLAKNDQQSAQISINPPQLGPIQITLNLNGDQAIAIFASPHAEVRQAIEAALPQLREMLSSTGISLGDASVGANLPQQSQHHAFPSGNRNQSQDENAILPANEQATNTVTGQAQQRGRGLVDLFA